MGVDDHDDSGEHGNEAPAESPQRIPLDALSAKLGFIETPELIAVREKVFAARLAGADSWVEATRYHDLAAAIIDAMPDRTDEETSARHRAQLGLMIREAMMYGESGQEAEFLEAIQDAIRFARQEGFNRTADALWDYLPEDIEEY